MSIEQAPPVVSQRNHFESVKMLVEDSFHRLPRPFQTEAMKDWLVSFAEKVVRGTAMCFEVGAQRGINQTAKLICDPEYFLTLKQRRKRQAEHQAAYQQEQEAESKERRLAPTQEQIDRDIRDLERWIPDTEADLVRMKERLAALRGISSPKLVRMKRTESPARSGITVNGEESI